MKIITITLLFCMIVFSMIMNRKVKESTIPVYLRNYINSIQIESINGKHPQVRYTEINKRITKVSLTWNFNESVQQDDWKVTVRPTFSPTFHWAPHLTPGPQHIIAQHVFRAPAVIAASMNKQVTFIPDLELIGKDHAVDWYMDLDAPQNTIALGMSKSSVKEHTAFIRAPGAFYPSGKVKFAFYILTNDGAGVVTNPFRQPLDFLWKKWGKDACEKSLKNHTGNLEKLVEQIYHWAFDSWKDAVWQEFTLNGMSVGAPQFIVNVTQSPNYIGEVNEREFRSIWNQAWFSSLRSAQGLFRYAKRTGNEQLLNYARKTKELALLFPQRDGLFPGLIATEMEQVKIDGKKYNRSKGWNNYYFGNSNRNPYTQDAKKSPLHILDMSFTAYLMLTWYAELERDTRLLSYARNYADALLRLQDKKGFFPAWLDPVTKKPLPILQQSPETSQSATFLFELYAISNNPAYKKAGITAIEAVMNNHLRSGQWEDFETYWSCSDYGDSLLVGKKITRNNIYKQNTFSIYWTAQALLKAYLVTFDKNYLDKGRRALDELLMYQSIWQPPFIYVDAVGGFGVMNFDGEWNDARQSLFAELIVDYGVHTNSPEYIRRGLAALKASFWMIYSPENQKTKKQWEAKWNFFGKEDYGFMMENYGHGGVTGNSGTGIGEFTIYDWGNGAAAEAYNRMVDHYGKDFVQ